MYSLYIGKTFVTQNKNLEITSNKSANTPAKLTHKRSQSSSKYCIFKSCHFHSKITPDI